MQFFSQKIELSNWSLRHGFVNLRCGYFFPLLCQRHLTLLRSLTLYEIQKLFLKMCPITYHSQVNIMHNTIHCSMCMVHVSDRIQCDWSVTDFFFMLFNSRELLANSVWFNLNTSWGSSYELCMTAWPICRKICLWCKAGHVQAAGLRLWLSLLTAVVLAVVVLLDLFTYCSLIGNGGERF